MKRTHKKILGFTGLGLVAAMTSVAATLPVAPSVGAVASVTDEITVHVSNPEPELTASSTSEAEITSPEYSFKAAYNHINEITATLVNKDNDGNVIKTAVIWDENLGGAEGEKTFNLNLKDYGGYGNFTITIEGTGLGGVPIERILTVTYKQEEQQVDPDPDSGDVDIEIEVPKEEVTKITANIYDQSGTLKKSVEVSDPADVEDIDLGDLPNGTYTMEIVSTGESGQVLNTETRTVVVDKPTEPGGGVDLPIKDQGTPIGQIVIKVKDEDGNVKKTVVINNPIPGDVINVDMNDLGSGDYVVEMDYYDQYGNEIATSNTDVSKSDDNGVVEVGVETQFDTVTTIEAYIYDIDGNVVRIVKADRATGLVQVYDKDGNLLFGIPNGFRSDSEFTVPMEGLESGDYKIIISYKNKDDKIIGDTKIVNVKYSDGKAVIVPDTGSFFQGLNISREDYLITGAIVFVVIGVVAFGIVKRNKTAGKKNRR